MTQPPKNKWTFAIGTTSIVPDTDCKLHYLIVDIDTMEVGDVEETRIYLQGVGANRMMTMPTEHGFHIYTDAQYTWSGLTDIMSACPHVDRRWLSIGQRRGYLYLADKQAASLSWPVLRMIIHRTRA